MSSGQGHHDPLVEILARTWIPRRCSPLWACPAVRGTRTHARLVLVGLRQELLGGEIQSLGDPTQGEVARTIDLARLDAADPSRVESRALREIALPKALLKALGADGPPERLTAVRESRVVGHARTLAPRRLAG